VRRQRPRGFADMTLRRALFMAACLAAAAPAAAQWPSGPQQAAPAWPAPQQQAPAADAWSAPQQQAPAPWPGTAQPGSFAPAPQAQQQQPPPCIAEFIRLRDDTEKKAKAIRAASDRHAPPKEACGLFNSFTAAEAKLIKYATDNSVWCSIPNEVIENLKAGHTKAMEIRAKVCEAANRPQAAAPRQPTLSDALGAPVPDAGNIKTGRGTFDTLTGSPLGTK